MMRAVVCLALAALAGCAGLPAQGPGSLGPPCALGVVEATWDEPGLYVALPAGARSAGLVVVDEETVRGAPAVDHPIVARWRAHDLLEVSRLFAEDGGSVRLIPQLPGELMLEATTTWDNETLLENVGHFLDGVGLGTHPERAAWERAIVASAHHGPYPVAYIVAKPDPVGLIDALEAEGPAKNGPSTLGDVAFVWGDWELRIGIGVRVLVADGPTDEQLHLMVDEMDRTRASTRYPAGDPPLSALEARANATFERLALAPPTYAGLSGGAGFPC
ncbi:MAG TPA: hypothetical protein VM370_02550 [Candidatus Thermoplasmatota archaeon]|nr:hypothetical protein [Candidatus Thermoplasmatota archaeon]